MTIIKTDAEGSHLDADATEFVTVIDQAAGLQWAINVQGLDALMDYESAEAFVAAQESIAGFTDWRLPTALELFATVDYSGADSNLMVDTGTFPDTQANWYWTAQATPWSPNYVYAVYFCQGHVGFLQRSTGAYVRLVRNWASSSTSES